MNEELQKALGELLGSVNSGIGAAGEFLASELPDVIQQLLLWYGVKSGLTCLVGIVAAILFPKLISVLLRKTDGKSSFFWDSQGDFSGYPLPAITVMMGVMGAIIIEAIFIFDFINIEWLQIWLAPKIWLIEYASRLAS